MTNRIGNDGQAALSPWTISNGSLWFQVAASGIAWFGLGVADMVITWRACVHEEKLWPAQFPSRCGRPLFRHVGRLVRARGFRGNDVVPQLEKACRRGRNTLRRGQRSKRVHVACRTVHQPYSGRRHALALPATLHSANVCEGAMSHHFRNSLLVSTACLWTSAGLLTGLQRHSTGGWVSARDGGQSRRRQSSA